MTPAIMALAGEQLDRPQRKRRGCNDTEPVSKTLGTVLFTTHRTTSEEHESIQFDVESLAESTVVARAVSTMFHELSMPYWKVTYGKSPVTCTRPIAKPCTPVASTSTATAVQTDISCAAPKKKKEKATPPAAPIPIAVSIPMAKGPPRVYPIPAGTDYGMPFEKLVRLCTGRFYAICVMMGHPENATFVY